MTWWIGAGLIVCLFLFGAALELGYVGEEDRQ